MGDLEARIAGDLGRPTTPRLRNFSSRLKLFAGGLYCIPCLPPGYNRNIGIEGDRKKCRDKETVVVVDYKTQFEKTLKKFDDKPRLRLIPTCGFKQRIM